MSNLNEGEEKYSLDTKRGATLRAAYTERLMKVYAVVETELEHISLLNTLTLAFSSAGSFFLASASSIIFGWATQGQSTERSNVFMQVVMPLCAVVAAGCFVAAGLAHQRRSSLWRKIGLSSNDIPKNEVTR